MITTRTKPAGRWMMGVIVALGLALALCAGAIFARPSAATAHAPAGANPPQSTDPGGSKAGQQAAPLVSGTATPTATCVVGGAPGPFNLVQHMPLPAADPGFNSDGR